MITVFTQKGCGKCEILKNKLNENKIEFEISEDMEEIISKGFKSIPVLKVDNEYFGFYEALQWIKK